MGEREQDRAKRELNEAIEKVGRDDRPNEPAPDNPELTDSQARGGAEMATPAGRTRPRGS